METRSKTSTLKIILVLLVILLVAGGTKMLLSKKDETNSLRTFQNEKLGLVLPYPGKYSMLEQYSEGDPTVPLSIALSFGEESVLVTPVIKTLQEVEKEKALLDSVLFQNAASRLKNSKITIGKFVGYKSLIDFTKSEYLLYAPKGTLTSLSLKIEIAAKTADDLLGLENTLVDMLTKATVQ